MSHLQTPQTIRRRCPACGVCVVQDLPAAQQESLLAEIDQAAAQMEQPTQSPSETSVSAGAFIQEAIAQNDPELNQQLAESEAGQPESPSLEPFRDWYRAARALGRSDDELADIEAIEAAAKSRSPKTNSATCIKYQ